MISGMKYQQSLSLSCKSPIFDISTSFHISDSYRNRAEIRASANLGHGSQLLMQFNLRNGDRHAPIAMPCHAGCLLEVKRASSQGAGKCVNVRQSSLSLSFEGRKEGGREGGRKGARA